MSEKPCNVLYRRYRIESQTLGHDPGELWCSLDQESEDAT